MQKWIQIRTRARTSGLVMFFAIIAGCGSDATADGHDEAGSPSDTVRTSEVADSGSIEPSTAAFGPVTDLPPNEMGEILVLEYHRLGENEGEWVRSAENFRNDLRTLYEEGFRP